MSPSFFCTLIFTLCILPTQASWLPQLSWHDILGSRSLTSHKEVGTAPEGSGSPSENDTTPYIFSVPSASIMMPTQTSQGMIVTSIVPIYEVCDIPGKNSTSCSTAFETITTESCSTVLTYAFTKTTISDCSHNVTFSSRTTYALATTTLSAAATDLQVRDAPAAAPSPSPVTYVQSIVSLYAAPWQSLAADTPDGITVLICTSDYMGDKSCALIEEVWIVHTETVPVTTTSTLSLSTSFSSDVVLLFGPTQSLVASAGNFNLSTLVEYSTMSPNTTTSTVVSTIRQSIVEAGTVTGDASTITKTLSLVGNSAEPTMAANLAGISVVPTTTLTSRTTLTSTVTVRPL
ncbi:hypothetical protein DL98DRAFT_520609 [Cadophora sp. DSE1049]|nr:hypothetical protein DL98DRAFT_520609 [Cadophora sp. DSE1049]